MNHAGTGSNPGRQARGGGARAFPASAVRALLVAVLFLLTLPSPAGADVVVANHLEADITGSVGPRFYAYHQGSLETFDVAADFDTGTYVDTVVAPDGTNLRLAAAPTVTWWDTDWGHRRCFTATNPGATTLTEHQVRFELDTTADVAAGLVQAGGEDYRAIAADNTTLLDLWVEGPMNAPATVLWVQMDLAPGATAFCLYFDNSTATTVSDQGAVFTYTTPQRVYFPAYHRFNGSGGNNGTLDVVSFVDGNQITVGATTVTRNAGGTATFSNVTEDTVILTTGPIAGRGRGDGMDALVPARFSGTSMVFPTNRGTQRWTLVAPFGGTATVEIYDGTTLTWSGNVGATAVVTPNGGPGAAEVGGGRSGRIISTNGVPIIVTHTASQNYDSLMVPPILGDDLYGVRSRGSWYGSLGGPASFDIYRSDNTFQAIAGLAAGGILQIYDGADLDGNGTAIRVTNMSHGIGALQQADRDGWESTSYLPESLLEDEYYLPSQATYVAFACPTATTINVGGTNVPCTPPAAGYPGHGIHGGAAAGTHIFSTDGDPFFAYYEDTRTNDETNLLGMKSAQAPTQVVVAVAQTSFDTLPAAPIAGSWTSPVIDTLATGTDVLGLLTAAIDTPANTTVTIQVASGATPAAALAAPFLGPDGTAATSYGDGETPLPFGHDFTDRYFIIRAQLAAVTPGDSPTVDLLSLGYDLPEVFDESAHAVVTDGATAATDWVLRVWTEDPALTGAGATLVHGATGGVTGASDAVVRLATEDQIVITGGILTQASGSAVIVGPGLAHNVSVDTTSMAGATMDLTWSAQLPGTGILVNHRAQLSFT